MKVELAELVAGEEAVAFAYTLTGTQGGPLMGIERTGKKVKIRWLQISKFHNGKMVERWGSSDQLGILQQIGASTISPLMTTNVQLPRTEDGCHRFSFRESAVLTFRQSI